ncbi:hypothetical protein MKX07_005286 [Trichoderma sp. CBMAI-0711]|nr:hypothetical protein MKX07_005286 [Trichoderma sp. CBMAI-0711]
MLTTDTVELMQAIIYYATNIFITLGLTGGTTALLATGVTGVVFIVSTVPAMLIIDKVGRKPMLLVGSIVMAVSMVIVGIIVAKFGHDWPHHVAAGWIAVALIWVYIAGFGATWGPVSWTLVSEIFPLSIRAKGASIGAMSNWLNNFAIAFFVPPMLEAWAWGTYIFFAGFLVVGIFAVWFYLPETKNATLEDMDRVFKSRTGEIDARLMREVQEEVGLVALVEGRAAAQYEKKEIHESQIEKLFLHPISGALECSPFTISSIAPGLVAKEQLPAVRTILWQTQTSDLWTVLHQQDVRHLDSEPLIGPGTTDTVDSLVQTSRSQHKTVSHLPQSEWKDYFSITHAAAVKNETATLLHFRYNLAPWVEAGDIGSSFGTEVMLLAQKRRSIMAAISSAASSQMAGSNAANGGSIMARRAPDPSFDVEEPWWRRLSFFQCDESTRNHNSFLAAEEPLETLLRFHARIDLAASLLTDQPPLTSLAFITSREPVDRALSPSTKSIYNACLAQLASCLQLLNGNSVTSKSPPFYTSTTQEILSPGAGSLFSSKWSSLWSNCQQWYHSRPVEMQPILEIRSVEAGQIDADNDSSFPIPVYTSSIALQCNIVYHISSRLLLQRKPRLLRLSSRQRHLSSLSWHAQQIAGTATRNDFAEQWDPILIAGLLWVARDMTHPSQQESLISCFRQISSATGIKLDEEIQTLRAKWNISQHTRDCHFSG